MARIFNGDYSTGDFRQWHRMMNAHVPRAVPAHPFSYGANFPPRRFYSAQVISEDKDAGYIARYELRENDTPWWGGQARSEVSGVDDTFAPVDSTRWYAWSMKFDTTFPTNHYDLGFGIFGQFHDTSNGGYSPPVAFGYPTQLSVSLTQPGTGFRSPGYWYLFHIQWPPPTSAGVVPMATHIFPVCELPFNLGQWHDIKLQIKWKQDQTGFIRMWWNGQRQTLWGGVDTHYGATLPPNIGTDPHQIVTGQAVQMGYYRDKSIVEPGIIYNAGFRMADGESDL